MNALACALLAVLSVWDYPSRQAAHERLRAEYVAAAKEGDVETMAEMCRKGVGLLPDDPVWRYNLACALARGGAGEDEALDALEKAIDLGFRDADAIANDRDFASVRKSPRFAELVEDARERRSSPVRIGPLSAVPATGPAGRTIALGEQNLTWNLETGCFEARMSLDLGDGSARYAGLLYVNRDLGHSTLAVTNYPGLTRVVLANEGRELGFGTDFPDTAYPYPVFGNCSRAMVAGPMWRSLPRALMTTEARRMNAMCRFYLSNQVWAFPAVDDYNFLTNGYGDVFASVSPYWFATEGRSWSDRPCLAELLAATAAMDGAVRADAIKRGLLAPTLQMLVRRSLKGVSTDEDYLSPKAHPTVFDASKIDKARLRKSAAALKAGAIPPVALILDVALPGKAPRTDLPELTYFTRCASAIVLRSPEGRRTFLVRAAGGAEYAFAAVHDEKGAAKVAKIARDAAQIDIDRTVMTATNRVDVAVFARNPGTGWGAPSFVSFAVVDPDAPYSDPALTPVREVEEPGNGATGEK